MIRAPPGRHDGGAASAEARGNLVRKQQIAIPDNRHRTAAASSAIAIQSAVIMYLAARVRPCTDRVGAPFDRRARDLEIVPVLVIPAKADLHGDRNRPCACFIASTILRTRLALARKGRAERLLVK